MGVYDRQIATAKRLIAKKGEVVTWLPSTTVQDNSKPWQTTQPGGTHPSYNVSIAFIPISDNPIDALLRFVKGTSVTDGTLKGYMGQVPFAPATNDSIVRDGKTYIVKSIDPLAPNGEPILYEIYFT